MKLAEYDKIYSALFFIFMVIDVRLTQSRVYIFLRWYVYSTFKKHNNN